MKAEEKENVMNEGNTWGTLTGLACFLSRQHKCCMTCLHWLGPYWGCATARVVSQPVAIRRRTSSRVVLSLSRLYFRSYWLCAVVIVMFLDKPELVKSSKGWKLTRPIWDNTELIGVAEAIPTGFASLRNGRSIWLRALPPYTIPYLSSCRSLSTRH
jgi:hypothetical protein